MRNIPVYNFFIFTIFFPLVIFCMDGTGQQRGWIARVKHRIEIDWKPLKFFTDNKAPEVRMKMEKYDPSHPEHKDHPFTGDATCHADVVSALTRQTKALEVARDSCLAKKSYKIERLKTAQSTELSYFSPNLRAIIDGYYKTHISATQFQLAKLSQGLKSDPSGPVIAGTKFFFDENIAWPDEINFPSPETVQRTVANPGVFTNTWNYLTSGHEDYINNILEETSQITAMAVLHFHPSHPHHTTDWDLNSDLPFHQEIIKNAVYIETLLISKVQQAILTNDTNTLIRLNPNNPDNKKMRMNTASYYSPLLKAIIGGYLEKVRIAQEEKEAIRIAKERDQKELAEKSQAIEQLTREIRRKLSDANNKEKLKGLSDSQRNTPLIAHNKLTTNRGAGLPEVREAHQLLADFSKVLEQMLTATPEQSGSPLSLNHSSGSLPSFASAASSSAFSSSSSGLHPSASPAIPAASESKPAAKMSPPPVSSIQTLVDTAHMAKPSPAPTPSAPPPPLAFDPSASSSASSSTGSINEAEQHQSSHSSPPRSPKETVPAVAAEEDFNPRAENAVPPPSSVAHAKLAAAMTPPPAQPKQKPAAKGDKKKDK